MTRGRWITALAITVCLTVIAATAFAYWTAGSTAGSKGTAAASSVNAGAAPTVSAVGNAVQVTWAATTLANGQPATGYRVARYEATSLASQTIQAGCSGSLTTTTCTETNVPAGSWRYAVTPLIGTSWTGAESPKSTSISVDGTGPVNVISLSSVTGAAAKSGTTVFYRGTAAGSFRLTNAVTDVGTGPASSTTALSGTTAGWTHSGGIVATPAAGPYVSGAFSWVAGTTSSPTATVTARDVAGNATATTLTYVNDSSAPTAGTVTYLDGFTSNRSVSVSFTTGTDAGSGIATRRLQRAAAPLSGGTCGSFGVWSDLGTVDPASPYADSGLASGCYRYRYVVADQVGNQHVATSSSVARVGYAGAVGVTPGLLSHWRLGESAASVTSYDSFTGTTGSALEGRSLDVGAGTWAHQAGAADPTIEGGRIRRNYLLFGFIPWFGYTIDYATVDPVSADYAVEADLVVRTDLADDMVGVIGRLNTANTTFYMARWEQADKSWNLVKYSNGSVTYLAKLAGQGTLAVGEAYRLRLEMSGSSLRLLLNGVVKATATDTTIPARGRAGVMDGEDSSSRTKSSTTGIHLDNFQVTPAAYPRAVDAVGTNTGDYKHGVTLGVPGALVADDDTAVQLDGVNDHVQVAPTSGLPVAAAVRSTEMWFKTSSAARQVLFRYGAGGAGQGYSLWLSAGGAAMAARGFDGGSDLTFPLATAVNDGAWHHVVMTYNGSALTIYVDGAARPSQAASASTAMDMYGFGIGSVIRPSTETPVGFFQGAVDEVSFYTTVLTPAIVADHYQLGGASAIDTTGPSGGSVTASGLVGTGDRYSTSTTLNLALSKGTDPSGLATSGAELSRATATLSNGVCGTFGDDTTAVATDPSALASDTVADQACYRYEYVVADTLGNSASYTSAAIKVDTTAPSRPVLTFSAATNAYWSGSGTTVYYRPGATSGSFTATAASADVAAGVSSYAFPALGTGWTSTPGAAGVTTYSWSAANPAAPGTKSVTASNNAALVSATSPFTMVADTTAPGAGSVSYTNGSTGSSTISVTLSTGTDGGSGVGTRLLQRASAPMTNGVCGTTFTGFSTVTNGTNPTSPVLDTVTAGSCYRYQYVVADQVGNTTTATSASVATFHAGGRWTFDAGTGTSAVDSSGNGNTATLQSGAAWMSPGRVGSSALNLNGTTSSWAASSTGAIVDTSLSYTVSAWIRPSAPVSGHRTFVAMEGTNVSSFYLQTLDSQARFAVRSNDSTNGTEIVVEGGTISPGVWTHVGAVHDSVANTISIYVGGVLKASKPYSTGWRAAGATTIGRARFNGPVDYFSGGIDDVWLTATVLTAAEIAALAAP